MKEEEDEFDNDDVLDLLGEDVKNDQNDKTFS